MCINRVKCNLFGTSTCKTVTLKENRAVGAQVSLRYQEQTRKQSTQPQAAQEKSQLLDSESLRPGTLCHHFRIPG